MVKDSMTDRNGIWFDSFTLKQQNLIKMKKITSILLALSMIIAFGAVQAQSKKSHKKKAKTELTEKKDHVKKESKKASEKVAKAEKKTSEKASKAEEKAEKHGKKMKSEAKNKMSEEAATASKKSEKASRKAEKVAKESATTTDANGKEIHTGPRGGKYYINKNGHKTYLSSEKKHK